MVPAGDEGRTFDKLLERQLEAFDLAWQSGTPPEIADFLKPLAESGPSAEQFRHELLVELIKIDLEYRWRRVGTIATVRRSISRGASKDAKASSPASTATPLILEDYACQFPELGSLTDLPAELIAEEFWVRRKWGDAQARNPTATVSPTASTI